MLYYDACEYRITSNIKIIIQLFSIAITFFGLMNQ